MMHITYKIRILQDAHSDTITRMLQFECAITGLGSIYLAVQTLSQRKIKCHIVTGILSMAVGVRNNSTIEE